MKVTCQRDGLLTACQMVSAAVAARTTHPVLSNIKATAEGDGLVLVGRDAETVGIRYELRGIQVGREGSATTYGPPEPTKGSHLVPSKAIGLLERNLIDDGEMVRVSLRPNDALFKTDRATIYTRLVEGRYPPYREVLNQARKQATV